MKKASLCYLVSIVTCVFASLLVLHKLSGILDDLHDIAPQSRQQRLSNVTSAKPVTNYHSAIRFVFVMGLEGTGHHTVGALIQDSPATQRLRQLGIHPNKTLDLALSLFNDDDFSGLWNAHCKGSTPHGAFVKSVYGKKTPNQQLQQRLGGGAAIQNMRQKGNQEFQERKRAHHQQQQKQTNHRRLQAINEPDTNNYLDQVVETLQTISGMAKDSNTKEPTTMAINTWTPSDMKRFNAVGQISYPNFRSECRKLNYPNLDLLYQACDRARVDCAHVYIYRDPMAIIRSTNRRFGHATILGAIHLYTSLLGIMYIQLHRHGPRTAGCWGILEDSHPSNWKSELSQMFGWKSEQEFESVLQQKFKPPQPLTDAVKNQLFGTNTNNPFGPYLKSFYDIHNDVIALCQEQHSRFVLGGNSWHGNRPQVSLH